MNPPEPFQDTIGVSLDSREQMRRASESIAALEIPGYQLKKELGRGTFGVVWEATRLQTGQQVAVKVVRHERGLDWGYLRRELDFLRELEEHPHTLTVLDAELEHDPPYIVTPLVDGGSLSSVGTERERDLKLVERWIRQLAAALAFIHDKGVIHCDLKPSNIFVSASNDIRVGDFGQSRQAMGPETSWGTLGFMAPEQCVDLQKASRPSVRWDVYGFGATAYWLLTGKVPRAPSQAFDGDIDTYREELCAQPLVPIRQHNPQVNPNLAAIVESCLHLDPEQRTQSMGLVVDDLKRWREGQPLLCRRPWKFPYLAGLALRRREVQFVLVLLVLVLAFGVHSWQQSRTRTFQHHVTAGLHALESGRREESVLHWLEALKYNEGDPTTRVRVALSPLKAVLPHQDRVTSLLVDDDGQTLVSGAADGEARVWSLRDSSLKRTLRHGSYVSRIALAPDGQSIATASWDGRARVFRNQQSEPVLTLEHREADLDLSVTDLAYSHDGSQLITADLYGELRRWNAETGERLALEHSQEDHFGLSQIMEAHPSRPLLAAIWGPNQARLWSLETGKVVSPIFGHEEEINSLKFSPDGRYLATAGDDYLAKLWSVEEGTQLKTFQHENRVNCLAFNSQGWLATGSEDGQVVIWEPHSEQQQRWSFPHRQPVMSLSFSPDGRFLAVGCGERENLWSNTEANGTAKVWDVVTGMPVAGPWAHDGPIQDLEFLPDGNRLVTGSGSGGHIQFAHRGAVRLWDLNLPAPEKKEAPRQERQDVFSVELPNGGQVSHGQKVAIRQYRFSPDGAMLATASADRTVRLWDSETGEPLLPPLLLEDEASAVGFHPSGRWLATASELSGGCLVRLWETNTGYPLSDPLACPTQVTTLEFEGSTLVAAGPDGTFCWEVAPGVTDKELLKQLPGRLHSRLDRTGKVIGLP